MSEHLTTQERTDLVRYHEAEIARLQGEVSKGNLDALPEYAVALAKRRAAELGIDLPAPVNPLQAKLDALIEAAQAVYDYEDDKPLPGTLGAELYATLQEAIKQAKL